MGIDVKQIKVRYFAVFREQAGLPHEAVETEAATLAELYKELADRYSFSLPLALVRASVASEFCPMDSSLSHGDEVVFIPPVAGG